MFDLLIGLCGAAVVLAALLSVYAIARRHGQGAAWRATATTRSAPNRWHYLLLTVAYLAVALYGSFVPLNYQPLELATAVERFRHVPYLELGVQKRADWVANILLFMPLSFLATAVLSVDVRSRLVRLLAVPPVVATCAALSVAVEFVQQWFPPRTVSLNDILAETIGGVLGAVVWLALGQTLTEWVRSYSAATRPRSQIDRLLEFYLVGLVVYSLLPLDLTINPAELAQKFRAGRLVLFPLTDLKWGLSLLYDVLADVVLFVPVGMYVSTAWTSPARPVRSLGQSTLLGALVAAAIELAQVPVFGRTSSTTDLLTATVGVFCGAWMMRRWRRVQQEPATLIPARDTRNAGDARWRRAWLLLAAAGGYSLVVLAVFCVGGTAIHHGGALRERFEGFWVVPFARLYRGSEMNAATEVLRKVLFFMPLGALLAAAIAGLRLNTPLRRLLLGAAVAYGAGVAFTIEMLQVFRYPHVPDVTDVVLCTSGTALGMWIALRLLRPGDSSSE